MRRPRRLDPSPDADRQEPAEDGRDEHRFAMDDLQDAVGQIQREGEGNGRGDNFRRALERERDADRRRKRDGNA